MSEWFNSAINRITYFLFASIYLQYFTLKYMKKTPETKNFNKWEKIMRSDGSDATENFGALFPLRFLQKIWMCFLIFKENLLWNDRKSIHYNNNDNDTRNNNGNKTRTTTIIITAIIIAIIIMTVKVIILIIILVIILMILVILVIQKQ